MELKRNTLLQGGRYSIVEPIGRGGFGVTYIAEQVMARRKVCIKEFFPKDYYKRDGDSSTILLSSNGFADTMGKFKTKFIKEAQTIATLDHPNIIRIHDVFEENGTAYYVMDHIDGESLSEHIKRKGIMRERDAVAYIRQVASALEHIHEQQIMHLDVKPGNIMVRSKDNRALLIDFGLSKHYNTESGEASTSTPIGVSHGFAPIEQYKQGGVNKFSPETDIYSLGATLYYLITGNIPPQAADILEDGISFPTHISSTIRKAIEKSMSYLRKDRPHSIKEFLALLDNDETVVAVLGADDERTIISPQEPAPKYEGKEEIPTAKREEKRPKRRLWLWLVIVLIAAVAIKQFIPNEEIQPIQPNSSHIDSSSSHIDPVEIRIEYINKNTVQTTFWVGEGDDAKLVADRIFKDEADDYSSTYNRSIAQYINDMLNEYVIIEGEDNDINNMQFGSINVIYDKSIPTKTLASIEEEITAGLDLYRESVSYRLWNCDRVSLSGSQKSQLDKLININIIFDEINVTNTSFIESGVYNNTSEEQPTNEIWYTSSQNGGVGINTEDLWFDFAGEGLLITISDKTQKQLFGAEIKDHIYGNSNGRIVFDDDITSIGVGMFCDGRNLIAISIPNSVKIIDDFAFYHCNNLTKVKLQSGITEISGCAFGNCTSLQNISIPDGVTTIGDEAFSWCGALTNINIPNSVTTIGSAAFLGCSSLTSIHIPDGITTINESVFSKCSSLTSVYIPNKVTTIDENAFGYCEKLQNISIPNGVTTIGNCAFEGCSSLKSITIPDKVTTIGDRVFAGCNNLCMVYCKATTPPTAIKFDDSSWDAFRNNADNRVIFVPRGSVSAYKNAEGWKEYADIIFGYDF